MKRIGFVAILVVVLTAVGAVAAFAAPGSPVRGFGMMGSAGHMGGSGMMVGTQGVPYGHGMMGGTPSAPYGAMMGDDLEKLLGIDHAGIHAAHVAGKSLVEIAAEKGVSEDQLIQKLLDGRKAALQQSVDAGKLTQASADQMLKFMETNIRTMVEAKGVSGMMNAGGMMGQHGANHMGGANHMNGSGMMGGTQGTPDTGGGTSGGSCHGGQAPAQQGTGVRDNMRLAPQWVQQG